VRLKDKPEELPKRIFLSRKEDKFSHHRSNRDKSFNFPTFRGAK
jgi:hypothetical protein